MTDQASIRQMLDQGLTHYGLGQVREACEVWKRVLEIDPQNPRALEYMKFVETNWAPNQPRDGKPYRPDEGSDPQAATGWETPAGDSSAAEESQQPRSAPVEQQPASVVQPPPAPVDPSTAPAPAEVAGAGQAGAPSNEKFTSPVQPVVQASQWGDLYDFGSQPGAKPQPIPQPQPLPQPIVQPQPAEPQPVLQPQPMVSTPEAKPEPAPAPEASPQPASAPEASPEAAAGVTSSTLPPHPQTASQEAAEPEAVTVSYATVPTVVRAPAVEPVAGEVEQDSAPEPPRVEPQPPFAGEPGVWENPPPVAGENAVAETEADVFEQVAAQAPLEDQSAAALDLVAGSMESTAAETPAASEEPHDAESLLKGARDLLELDDFSGALDLLGKLSELMPDSDEIEQMRAEARSGLIAIYSSKIGDLNKIPRVTMAQDEIIWLNLDHRAGFILSLVDGHLSFDEILSVSGLELTEGMRILVQLIQEKVIEVL